MPRQSILLFSISLCLLILSGCGGPSVSMPSVPESSVSAGFASPPPNPGSPPRPSSSRPPSAPEGHPSQDFALINAHFIDNTRVILFLGEQLPGSGIFEFYKTIIYDLETREALAVVSQTASSPTSWIELHENKIVAIQQESGRIEVYNLDGTWERDLEIPVVVDGIAWAGAISKDFTYYTAYSQKDGSFIYDIEKGKVVWSSETSTAAEEYYIENLHFLENRYVVCTVSPQKRPYSNRQLAIIDFIEDKIDVLGRYDGPYLTKSGAMYINYPENGGAAQYYQIGMKSDSPAITLVPPPPGLEGSALITDRGSDCIGYLSFDSEASKAHLAVQVGQQRILYNGTWAFEKMIDVLHNARISPDGRRIFGWRLSSHIISLDFETQAIDYHLIADMDVEWATDDRPPVA